MKKRDFKAILMLIKKHVMERDELAVLPKTEVIAKPEFGFCGGTVRSWDCRNTIPYEVILDYCVKESLNPLDVFYEGEIVL